MADPAPKSPVDQLQADVAAFILAARTKATGGLTVAEFGSLVVQLLHLCVAQLDQIPADKAAKKAWALQIIGALFDAVAGFAVPLPLQPFWLLARPLVRQLVLAAASGALERVLILSRAADPGPAPTPAPVPA